MKSTFCSRLKPSRLDRPTAFTSGDFLGALLRRSAACLAMISWVLCLAATVSAQTGGCDVVLIRSGMDNYISLPFQRDPVATARVAAVGATSLRLNGAIWTVDQFAPVSGRGPVGPGSQLPQTTRNEVTTYYALITTGKLEGVFYKILSNTIDTMVLATEGDDLTAHPAGAIALDDLVEVRPYWTLATVFGVIAGDLVLSSRATPTALSDEVSLPDNLAAGVVAAKRVAGGTYYYLTGQGWRRVGDRPGIDQADTILPPGQMLSVRRRAAGNVELFSVGEVLQHRFSIFVQGGNGVLGTDSYLGLTQGAPVTLNLSALVTTTNLASSPVRPSPSRTQILDRVFLYQSGPISANLPVVRSFYYLNGLGWRDPASTATNIGDTISIVPGATIVVRKAPTSVGVDWLQPR